MREEKIIWLIKTEINNTQKFLKQNVLAKYLSKSKEKNPKDSQNEENIETICMAQKKQPEWLYVKH